MRMAAPSQAKLCELLRDIRYPKKRPSQIERKWIAVASNRSIIGDKNIVPVHSPAEILSMDRASANRAASRQERMALSSLFTLCEIFFVVNPESFLWSCGIAS